MISSTMQHCAAPPPSSLPSEPKLVWRRCVGCRQAAPTTELIRMVLEDSEPVVDVDRRRPGRGVSAHLREKCLNKMFQTQGLGRALKIPRRSSHAGAQKLRFQLELNTMTQLRDMLRAALKRGDMTTISNEPQPSAALLWCSTDADKAFRRSLADSHPTRLLQFGTSAWIGTLLACDPPTMVTVFNKSLAERLERMVKFLSELRRTHE